ncbi:hypothetical protein GCM10008986_13210 [Salinibacillus aidingensis]|uniref:Na+-translocating membrane potential-generating system MpsC domain-containing protein n=1 Tax=Salinibacillus aidingensis TaxID=237684 RepID=A0ABN1B2F6_9BACI
MDQDTLNEISSHTSKLLRKNFGRGPKSCQTIISNKYIAIYIRGFVSPMEDVLLSEGQQNYVEKARTVIIDTIIKELIGIVKVSCKCEVEEYYHDWNFPNNSGVILFVLSEPLDEGSKPAVNQSELENEVVRISELVQKVPAKIYIHALSPYIYLVERAGILIPIEKALVDKGFKDELLITKDALEKEYFHKYGRLKELFDRDVKDIFVDWDFKEDKCYMVFVLGK